MTDLIKRLDDRLTAPENLGQLAREILSATRSESTREAYRRDWERFSQWASENNCEEYPVSSHVLGAYLVWMHGEGYGKSTINRTVTVFRLAHDELDDPTGDRAIRAILAGIMRRDRRPTRQAKPMSFGELQAICEALSESNSRRALRDRAVISLGWIGALRASEIVAIDWSDLTEVTEGLEVRIRESKTNKTGDPEIVAIPYLRHELKSVCAIRALIALLPDPDSQLDWNIAIDRPVFTSTGELTAERMSERTIERALARACKLAGLNKRFTSHSLRRGFATHAAHRGISMYALKAHGRWKTSAVAEKYIERADLWRHNPIRDLLG
jgi:integrase